MTTTAHSLEVIKITLLLYNLNFSFFCISKELKKGVKWGRGAGGSVGLHVTVRKH